METLYEKNPAKYVHLLGSSLLGSKTLNLNVLEIHFVMLANHDQNA